MDPKQQYVNQWIGWLSVHATLGMAIGFAVAVLSKEWWPTSSGLIIGIAVAHYRAFWEPTVLCDWQIGLLENTIENQEKDQIQGHIYRLRIWEARIAPGEEKWVECIEKIRQRRSLLLEIMGKKTDQLRVEDYQIEKESSKIRVLVKNRTEKTITIDQNETGIAGLKITRTHGNIRG